MQRNVKIAPIPPPPPNPESLNKTAQGGNGDLTILTLVIDDETLTMSSTVFSNPVVVSPVRNIPELSQFTL